MSALVISFFKQRKLRMGTFSLSHWIVLLLIAVVLYFAINSKDKKLSAPSELLDLKTKMQSHTPTPATTSGDENANSTATMDVPVDASKKTAAGLFGILLGGLGIHKFFLGYTIEGVIMLLTSIVGLIFVLGIPTGIIGVIGLIEGILYLTKSDEEFFRTYILNKKGWF